MKKPVSPLLERRQATRPALGVSLLWKGIDGFARFLAYVGVFLIATNLLTRDQYGEAQKILSMVVIVSGAADFGLSGASRWFVGRLEVQRPHLIRPYVVRSVLTVLLMAMLAAAAVVLLRAPIATLTRSSELEALIWIVAGLVVLMSLNNLQAAIIGSLERFGAQAAVGVVLSAGTIAATVWCLWQRPDAHGLVLAYLLASIPAVVLELAILVWATGGSLASAAPAEREAPPSPLGYGWWVFLAGLGGLVINRMNVLLIGAYHDNSEVAAYSVAERFYLLPALGILLFVQVVAPRIARLQADGDQAGIQQVFQVVNGIVLVFFAAITVTLCVGCGPLLAVISPKYTDTVPLIWILMTSVLPRILATLALGLLIASGRPKPVVAITFATVGLTFIGGLVVVPASGALGIVWVTAAVQLVMGVAAIATCCKLMGLRFRVTLRGARQVLWPSVGKSA